MVGLDNPIHLAFLLLIVLLIFGAKRLPEIGRSLGSGLRGFRESISGEATAPIAAETEDTPVTSVSKLSAVDPEVTSAQVADKKQPVA